MYHRQRLIRIEAKLDDLLSLATSQGVKVMAVLDDLTAQVAKNTDTEASAVLALQGIKAALDAAIASGNPAALKALSDKLGASQAELAAAIVANTPAAP